MSVSEYERHQILTWFEQHMGPELAPAMMNLVPPTGWSDIATKRDLDHMRIALDAKIEREIGDLRAEMQHEIGNLRAEMQHEIGNLRAEIGNLRGEMHREIGKLRREMIAGLGLVTAIIGSLVTFT